MAGPLVVLKQVLERGRQTFLIKDADGGTASRKRGPAGAFGEGIPGGTALIRSRAVGGLPGSGISKVLYPFSAPALPLLAVGCPQAPAGSHTPPSSPSSPVGCSQAPAGRTLRRAPSLRFGPLRSARVCAFALVRSAPRPGIRLTRVRAFAPVRSLHQGERRWTVRRPGNRPRPGRPR